MRRLLAPVILLLVTVLALGVARQLRGADGGDEAAAVSHAGAAAQTVGPRKIEPRGVEARADARRALVVLRGWDRRRSAAYAAGDADALRALYVAGSAAGARDATVLRAYQRRGLTVAGLQTQLLAVTPLRVTPRRLRVRVRERLGSAWVRTSAERVRLPRDRADTRVLTLVREAGRWQLAGVRTARP